MTPILFPDTYLEASQINLLHDLFGPLTLYQPAEDQIPEALWRQADQGRIHLRIPVKGREAELARCVADYSAWAAQRQGRRGQDSRFLRHQARSAPFFEDSAITRLKSAIRKGAEQDGKAPGQKGVSAEDRLFQARLFLTLAQAYDRQDSRLAQELARCGEQEREMLNDLQGKPSAEQDVTAAPSASRTRSAEFYQAGPRLRAWLRLWLADQGRGKSTELLVTRHLQSVEELEAMAPEFTSICTLDALPPTLSDPVLKELLLEWLQQLARTDCQPCSWPLPPPELSSGRGDPPVTLEVYAVCHQPWTRFDPFSDRPPKRADSGDRQIHRGHGVLVLIRAAQ